MAFIPLEVYANNPSTTVSSGGTTAPAGGTVETWTVASSATFPGAELGATQFHVADPVLPGEMITVQNVTGTTWTVQRGAEASVPVAHTAGFTVVQVVTAGTLAGLAYPSWQFPVQQYGAQGDGKIGTGGTGASGQAVLTDSGATFVNAAAPAGDIGKVIVVNQGTGSATVATNPFCGTIISVNSATSITLSGNLAATCASAPYVYGTDDAAPINAAVLAAAQWAAATGNYKAQVIFEPCLYMLGALVQSTAVQWSPFNAVNYTYNTHIPVPFTGQFARKLVIDLVGPGGASSTDFWGSSVPSIQGCCLVSAVFPPSQPDATFGQMSVVGGPALNTNIGNGGIGGGNFANALLNVDGITIVTPYNSQIYGFDLRLLAAVNVISGGNNAFAPVNFAAQTVGGPWLRQTNIPGNGVAVGLAMPGSGNNDNCAIGFFCAEGISRGLMAAEHFDAARLVTIYCDIGIATPAVGQTHGGYVGYWSCEGCNTGIDTLGSSAHQYPFNVSLMDCEVVVSTLVNDPNSVLFGTMYFFNLSNWTPSGGALIASNYRMINTRMPLGVWAANATLGIPGPPAAPSSTVTQQNTPYRDAVIYASATTGITNVAVGPLTGATTATGMTAGNGVIVSFRVPSGWWYSVTYTGVLTTKWVME